MRLLGKSFRIFTRISFWRAFALARWENKTLQRSGRKFFSSSFDIAKRFRALPWNQKVSRYYIFQRNWKLRCLQTYSEAEIASDKILISAVFAIGVLVSLPCRMKRLYRISPALNPERAVEIAFACSPLTRGENRWRKFSWKNWL